MGAFSLVLWRTEKLLVVFSVRPLIKLNVLPNHQYTSIVRYLISIFSVDKQRIMCYNIPVNTVNPKEKI